LECLCIDKNNMKCTLKNSVAGQTYGLDLSDTSYSLAMVSCEQQNEFLGSIKFTKFTA